MRWRPCPKRSVRKALASLVKDGNVIKVRQTYKLATEARSALHKVYRAIAATNKTRLPGGGPGAGFGRGRPKNANAPGLSRGERELALRRQRAQQNAEKARKERRRAAKRKAKAAAKSRKARSAAPPPPPQRRSAAPTAGGGCAGPRGCSA